MPLFASVDSVYTEPDSETLPGFSLSLYTESPYETLPEFSLSLHEEASSDMGFTSFHLVDRETLNLHDHLTGFVIPDMVGTPEMGYDVINSADRWSHYPGSAHDPAMEMEVFNDIFNAITDTYVNGHHQDSAGASQWEQGWVQKGDDGQEYKWHKHNEDGSTSVANSNPEESDEWIPIWKRQDGETTGRDKDEEDRLWGNDDDGITPDSEGGGANIVAIDYVIHDAYNQEMVVDLFDQNLAGESMFQNHLFTIDAFPVEGMAPQSPLDGNFIGMDMSSYFM